MTEPKRPNSLVLNEALLKDFVDGKLQPAIEERVAKPLEARPELLQKIVTKSGDGFLQKLRDIQQRSKADSPAEVKEELVQAVAVDHKPSGKELSIPPQLANYAAYQVTKELGRGGMGIVYLAKNVQMDRFEVLKVLNERLLDHDGAKERFLREIRAVSKLNHPNIVTSYSILPLDDLMVFAMEFVHGMDLHKFIHQHKPLSIGQACSFAKQIAAGLQHAHERKLVHRDIKPSNVIVYKSDGQLQLKILDFGLAKASSEEAAMAAGLTQDGTILGTPEYMSPEQTLNAAKADIRADIYSLGCTLYHMLAAKPPFTGSHGAVLVAHAQREATGLNLVRPEIPVELATVVAKMIAKDVSKRYQTPSEVSNALNPFISSSRTTGTRSTSKEVEISNTVNDLNGPDRDTSVEGPAPELSLESASQLSSPAEELFAATANLPKKTNSIQPVRKLPLGKQKLAPPRWFLPAAIASSVLLTAFAFVMLGVFVFRTTNGTIVIEKMPLDADVVIDGKKMSITWNAGKDRAEVSIDPGSHQLQVLNQGNEIYGDKVTVKGGDATLVKIVVEKPKGGSGLPQINVPLISDSNSLPKSQSVIPSQTLGADPLGETEDSTTWVSLFNGKDLTGWKQHPESTGKWSVEQGEIVGRGVDQSHLFTERDDFTDFHIRAEARINANGNSGICFRTKYFGTGRLQGNGYEANIEGDKAVAWQTGSLMHIHPNGQVAVQRVATGDWFEMEVIVRGNVIVIKVNGNITAKIEDTNRTYDRGHIALQQLGAGTEVRFRKIEIKAPNLKNAVPSIDSLAKPEPPKKTALKIEMLEIQSGYFSMGSPKKEVGRQPDEVVRQVTITKPFRLGKYEVSQDEFKQIMGFNPSKFNYSNLLPVETVTWFDAVYFCNKLSESEGLSAAYTISHVDKEGNSINAATVEWNPESDGYRLPTEAEWEYACRASESNKLPFSFGDNISATQVNYDGNYPYDTASKGLDRGSPSEVALFTPNAFGLHQMHGNVCEWCWDRYGKYEPGPQRDPIGPGVGTTRVFRGGSWFNYANDARSAYRNACLPEKREPMIGFRIARNGQAPAPNWIQLFNGKDLSGWKGNSKQWFVRAGCIVGRVATADGLRRNTCLIWDGGELKDFEIEFECKVTSNGNSGLQFRSKSVDATMFVLNGYQADIDGSGTKTGVLYEEGGRGILANQGQGVMIDPTGQKNTNRDLDLIQLKSNMIPAGWNRYLLIAKGNKLQYYVNSVLASEVVDQEVGRSADSGLLGLQLHTLTAMNQMSEVEFRNIRLRKVSSPTEFSSSEVTKTIQHFSKGSVWEGTRTYKSGGYAGKTVSYFVHVGEINGTKFKGHKFDNGRNRNYVELEGELDGQNLTGRT